jgi:hypothetical protein
VLDRMRLPASCRGGDPVSQNVGGALGLWSSAALRRGDGDEVRTRRMETHATLRLRGYDEEDGDGRCSPVWIAVKTVLFLHHD